MVNTLGAVIGMVSTFVGLSMVIFGAVYRVGANVTRLHDATLNVQNELKEISKQMDVRIRFLEEKEMGRNNEQLRRR